MNWSVVNTSLFNLCFGGRARRRAICQVCLSEQHATDACPNRVFAFGQSLFYSTSHPGDMLLPGTALGAQQRPPLQPAVHGQAEICRLFNAIDVDLQTAATCTYVRVAGWEVTDHHSALAQVSGLASANDHGCSLRSALERHTERSVSFSVLNIVLASVCIYIYAGVPCLSCIGRKINAHKHTVILG